MDNKFYEFFYKLLVILILIVLFILLLSIDLIIFTVIFEFTDIKFFITNIKNLIDSKILEKILEIGYKIIPHIKDKIIPQIYNFFNAIY